MEKIAAAPVTALEYWSLRPDRRADGVGKISRTHGSRSGLKSAAEAIDHAAAALADLAALYLFGDAPFVPGEASGYGDYDQLMRRDEWFGRGERSEEHTSELQSLMRISYAVFCLKKKNKL